MRGSGSASFKPYRPINRYNEYFEPYICRLAPDKDGAEIEWLDNGCDGLHYICVGRRGENEKRKIEANENTVKISGLETETEYEFYVEAENGKKSKTRLFRTGCVPEGCTVINYLHPEDPYYDYSGKFLGTPQIVRCKSGRLVASMDVFQSFKPQNITIVFYSDDDGRSWRYMTDLYPFFWTSLLYHKDVLYAIGVTTEYGHLHICSSEDEGETWSDTKTIFCGSDYSCVYGGVHRAPMQFVPYKGRLYTSCEYGCWEYGSHLPAVISIDEDADLAEPKNWYISEVLPYDGKWAEKSGKQGDTIEGNIIEAPDGELYNFMRYKVGEMLKLKVDTDNFENKPMFDEIVEAPVVNSMFRLFRADGKYLLITNRKTPKAAKLEAPTYRNVLSLFESDDLKSFKFVKDIFNYEEESAKEIGFQYPAYLYEDGKLSLVVRSAFNKSDSAHNSNYMLFCRI